MNHKLRDNITPDKSKKDNNTLGKTAQSVKGVQDQLVENPKIQSVSTKAGRRKGSVRVREFDYDRHPTKLIKMVEKKKWDDVIQRCANNSREVSSWMCRFHKVDGVDGKKKKEVCQKMLPLHSAIAHQAPLEVIKVLVAVYPDSVKECNEKQRLSLHMAFGSGVSLEAAAFLFDANPDAAKMKDNKGHTPLHILKAYRKKYENDKGEVSSDVTDKNRKDLIIKYLGNRDNRNLTGNVEKKDNETVHIKKGKDDRIGKAELPLEKKASGTSQSQKNKDEMKVEAKSQLYNDDEMVLPSYDSDSSFYDSFDGDSEDEYSSKKLINYWKSALDGFSARNLCHVVEFEE